MEYFTSGELFDDLIRQDIREFNTEFNEMVQGMNKYRTKDWFESKNKLLAKCTRISAYISEQLILATAGRNQAIQAVIAYVIPAIAEPTMTKEELIKLTAWFIEAGEGIFYSLERVGDELMVNSNLKLDEEEQEALKYRQYPPPELDKPEEWEQGDSRVILGKYHNKHSMHQSVDVLNLLAEIKWTLDPYILAMEEESNKKEFKDQEELDAWMYYKNSSRKVYNEYSRKEFYFKWKFDKRGRQYTLGYHINLQSTGFKKASLCFGEPYKLTGEL